MTDHTKYSEIAASAFIKSPELVEHPIHLGPRVEVHKDSSLGRFSFINNGTIVYPNVEIGRYCSIGRGCEIGAANHPTHFLSSHTFQYHGAQFPKLPGYNDMKRERWLSHKDTKIGNDVWIGAQVVIPAGVKIGDGAIIAANAVVTKDIPPYAIAGGCPAKIIRFRFAQNIIDQLLEIKWWELMPTQLSGVSFSQIEDAIPEIISIKTAHQNKSL